MAIKREALYAALLARMGELAPGTVRLVTRKDLPWSEVPATQQPTILVISEGQVPDEADGMPTKWSCRATIYVYAQRDTGEVPEKTLHTVIDAIDLALDRRDNERKGIMPDQAETTLGGACLRAYVSGPIEVYPGIDGEQGVAVVPVEMLAVG